MTQLFVKIENNSVVSVWDTPFPANEAGLWHDAVEVRNPVIAGRQHYGPVQYDLTTTPVQIIWPVLDIAFADRQESLIQQLTNRKSLTTDETVQAEIDADLAKVVAAKTHDDIDAINLTGVFAATGV